MLCADTPPLYTELSSARSHTLDSVASGLSLSRKKLEAREVGVGYCNGGLSLSAGVKPPPTIPESHEPPSVCPSGSAPSVSSAGGNLHPLSPLSSLAPSLASLSPMAPVASQVPSAGNPLSHLVQQQQQQQSKLEAGTGCSLSALGGAALQLRSHLPIVGSGTDCSDLNLDTLDTLQDTLQGGLECDVDQVSSGRTTGVPVCRSNVNSEELTEVKLKCALSLKCQLCREDYVLASTKCMNQGKIPSHGDISCLFIIQPVLLLFLHLIIAGDQA